MENDHHQQVLNFIICLQLWKKVTESFVFITLVIAEGLQGYMCVYVTIFYSIRGTYSSAAIIKCRKTKENNWGRNWGLNDCWFWAPPPIMRQISSSKSVLHINLAYHNTQNTHPSNWYLSFKTLNIQCQQYQPRQQFHSKSYLLVSSWVFCFTLQTILHIAHRVLLIIVPAQRILIQSDQRKWPPTKWLGGASVTGRHCWGRTVLWRASWKAMLLVLQGLQDSDTSDSGETVSNWLNVDSFQHPFYVLCLYLWKNRLS